MKESPLRRTLEIGSGAAGGYVTANGPDEAPVLKLGHHPSHEASGLIGTNAEGEALSENPWKLVAWEEEEVEGEADDEADEESTEESPEIVEEAEEEVEAAGN